MCIQKCVDEVIEEPLECESGVEEYMREYALSQLELIRFNEFKDKKCPVVLH